MSTQPDSQHKNVHWYIQKNGKASGPFPAKLIGSYLLLGRIDLDTPVSPDQKKWIPIGKLPSLIPDEFKNTGSMEDQLALRRARLREDERSGESRREDGVERRSSDRSDSDRRNPSERRQNDEMVSEAHKKLKAAFTAENAKARRGVLIASVFVILIAVVISAGFFLLEPVQKIVKTDCNAQAVIAVNWQSCNKNNADLVAANLQKANLHSTQLSGALLVNAQMAGANLAYANLDNANLSHANLTKSNLKGASLNNTNLTGATLIGADLSYANLNQAILQQVQVQNTRFDYAIWSDGKTCAKGSVDQCLPSK